MVLEFLLRVIFIRLKSLSNIWTRLSSFWIRWWSFFGNYYNATSLYRKQSSEEAFVPSDCLLWFFLSIRS